MTRKKQENPYFEDCWLYIAILTTLVILLESLKSYTFHIGEVNLTYSLFLLPAIYLLANFITKTYDYKKTIAAIAVSGVISVCFMAIMSFALSKDLMLSSLSGEFCGYVISQFVNLTIYMFLLNNTKAPWILIFINYLFSLIVYYLFYTLIYLNMIVLDNFWTGYFITLGIQFIVCIPLSILDCKIKIEKNNH